MVLSKLPKRIQAYYGETGIYQYLSRQARMYSLIHRRQYTSILNKAKKVSAIKLNKPLQTVFIIFIVGLLTTLVVFGVEIMICPHISLYYLKFHHFFYMNVRVLRRTFKSNKNLHVIDFLGQQSLLQTLRKRQNVHQKM